MRKAFRFTDEDETKWNELKELYKLTSDTDLMRFLLTNHWSDAKNISEASPSNDEIQKEGDIFAGMNEYQIQVKLIEMELEAKNKRVQTARERMSDYQDSKGATTLKEILTKNPVKETVYEPLPSLVPRPVESWPDGVDELLEY
jgi:hypothetical protein